MFKRLIRLTHQLLEWMVWVALTGVFMFLMPG